MLLRTSFMRFHCLVVLSLLMAGVSRADTLKQITTPAAQGGNDSLSWAQKGADGTVLGASFNAATALSNAVAVSLAAPNSVISTVCNASPCSWVGTGFTAGHSLLWTSDAGNGGSGPVTLTFAKNIAGAGALIQADIPGAFTAQIQVFNGGTALGSYTVASNSAGDPVYLGALDQSGANITKVVFSLTACQSLCTDFGLDTVAVNAGSATSTVTLSPTSLTFASTKVGSTTAAQAVTVKNTGASTVTLSSESFTGPNATSFLKSATTCGATLSAGASCTISVEFKPSVGGSLTASLSVADTATGSPQLVALKGTGTAPAISLSPTSIAFSPTNVGSVSASTLVTVTNTGNATLNIASIKSTGTNASSFYVPHQTCGSTLAAGANCTFSVAFKPTTAGALSAAIQVADNVNGSPQPVKVTGTGTSPAKAALSPTSIAFSSTKVGTVSASKLVTLTNTGTVALSISSMVTSGKNASSFYLPSNTCGLTLAAGSKCTFNVAFKPTTTGAQSAVIDVNDNATGSPQTVAVSGTGK